MCPIAFSVLNFALSVLCKYLLRSTKFYCSWPLIVLLALKLDWSVALTVVLHCHFIFPSSCLSRTFCLTCGVAGRVPPVFSFSNWQNLLHFIGTDMGLSSWLIMVPLKVDAVVVVSSQALRWSCMFRTCAKASRRTLAVYAYLCYLRGAHDSQSCWE